MTIRTRNWVASSVGVAVAALLVAGCGGAERDSGGTITASGDVGVQQLAVGDCVTVPADSDMSVSSVTGIPCTEAHDGEVVLTQTMAEGAYPGAASVMSQAESLCSTAADAYLGISLDETELTLTYLYPPDESSWAQDRGIACLVHHPGQDLTASVRSAGSQHLMSAAAMKLGQCYGEDGLEPVPCSAPHLVEVFAVGTLADGAYGMKTVTTAGAICEKAFRGYVGVAYGSSTMDFIPFFASDTGWAAGDHSYACLLMARDQGLTTGSAKGTKK